MTRAIFIRLLATLGLVLAGSAQAANIYNVTGPSPFGFQNQHVLYVSWSQSITYTNVSISVPLQDGSSGGPIAGVEGTMYLVNQIGPGTTPANNAAPPIPISGLSATFTNIQLWTGLTLPPGTYYLVFASANNNPMSLSPEGVSSPVTLTAGLGIAQGFEAGVTDINNIGAFPPANAFNAGVSGANIAVSVTGDTNQVPPAPPVVQAPALGVLGLASLAILLLVGVWRRARRRAL